MQLYCQQTVYVHFVPSHGWTFPRKIYDYFLDQSKTLPRTLEHANMDKIRGRAKVYEEPYSTYGDEYT